MVSVYGYITVADLEKFMTIATAGLDSVDAEYTDAAVEAIITMAEEWVNNKTHTTFTAPIPDGILYATKLMAKYFMKSQMVEDKHIEVNENVLKDIMMLAEDAITTDEDDGPYSISMRRDRPY